MSIGVSGSKGFIGSAVFEALALDENCEAKKILRVGEQFLCNDYFDVIVHCAEVSDRQLVNNLGESYRTCATSNVSHLISRCKYLIYLSSSVLYESSDTELKFEKSKTVISDNYSATKVAAENIVLSAGGAVLRISNVFGDGMSNANVISDILAQLGSNVITLYNIYAVRDFIHVEDVAYYIKELAILQSDGGLINLGSGVGWSVNDIAKFVNINYGCNETKLVSKAPPNLNSIVLNIDKLHEICEYRSVNSLQKFLLTKIGKC